MAKIEALNYIGRALNPETTEPFERRQRLLEKALIGGAGTMAVFNLIGVLTGSIEVILGGGIVGLEEAVRNIGKVMIEDIRESNREKASR